MVKKSKKSNDFKRPLILIPLLLLLLLLVCYLGRGWIRRSLVPSLAEVVYARRVQSTFDKEYGALGNPFETLGMNNIKTTKECTLIYARHFKVQVYCAVSYSSYSDKVSNLHPDLSIRSKTLEQTLESKDWIRGNTSLETLGTNISTGIDWTPDAAYMKTVGKTFCLTDFNTAFSKPKSPALSGSISCSQPFQIF
jgi:hypothetical protein